MIDVHRTGDVLLGASDDLVRLWRAARLRGGPRGPSRIDSLVEAFLRAAGDALVRGVPAAPAASGVAGLARLDARDVDRSRQEIDQEWTALAQVLGAAAEAIGCDPAARAELAAAVEAARAATAAALQRADPTRIVIIWEWTAGA